MQYQSTLTKKGILYAQSALAFNKTVYVSEIVMVDGAIGPCICKVSKVIEGREKARTKKAKAKAKARRAQKKAHQDSNYNN